MLNEIYMLPLLAQIPTGKCKFTGDFESFLGNLLETIFGIEFLTCGEVQGQAKMDLSGSKYEGDRVNGRYVCAYFTTIVNHLL